MRVVFTREFLKQIRKIQDKHLAKKVEDAILQVKNATTLSGIHDLKKLKGYTTSYRLRIGDYRIGVYLNGDTVEFACFMSRKDIYKYFP